MYCSLMLSLIIGLRIQNDRLIQSCPNKDLKTLEKDDESPAMTLYPASQ
jgi:hypothetical protein